MRTRPLSRRTLPSTTPSTSSSRAIVNTGTFRSRKLTADVRDTTRSVFSCARRAVISSVSPAAKNSCVASPERLSRGSTTIDRISGRAAVDPVPVRRQALQPINAVTTTATMPDDGKSTRSTMLGLRYARAGQLRHLRLGSPVLTQRFHQHGWRPRVAALPAVRASPATRLFRAEMRTPSPACRAVAGEWAAPRVAPSAGPY